MMFTVKITHTIDRGRTARLVEKIKIRKEKERKKLIEDLKKGYVAILEYDRDYPKSEEPRKAITKHIVKGGTR